MERREIQKKRKDKGVRGHDGDSERTAMTLLLDAP